MRPLHHHSLVNTVSLSLTAPYLYTAAIQQLYRGCIAIQLYSSYTVYILYSIPLGSSLVAACDADADADERDEAERFGATVGTHQSEGVGGVGSKKSVWAEVDPC